ncbi:histone-lysine N-methyltransferase SUV39H2-like isoform X2 [Ornithodoros turicata]|uniref:histone-lysine N-methyltransferase SUV39H2-like isoform X2 n=1 Tax=Ornithodoros turicata TaxID=34597 RepID=UPI00313876C7
MDNRHPIVKLTRLEDMHGLYDTYKPSSSSADHDEVEEYEVQEVKGVRVTKQGEAHFLLKWRGWDSSYNSWEPESSVEHCQDLVRDYCFKSNSMYRFTLMKKALQKVSHALHPDVYILAKLMRHDIRADAFISRKDIEDMRKQVAHIVKDHDGNALSKLNIKKGFGGLRQFLEAVEQRQHTLAAMQQWETYINDTSGESAHIYVENFADCEAPPLDFVYLRDYQPGPGVTINNDPPLGCSCKDCFEEKDKCCAEGFGMRYAYNHYGTLLRPFGSAIYECNKRCTCGPDCNNRVVQKGRQVPVVIFRTGNGRGWGVRTLQRIKKGTFVMEYLGEIITNEEAERRGKAYDAEGMTYLFDLDYTEPESEDAEQCYSVDAANVTPT